MDMTRLLIATGRPETSLEWRCHAEACLTWIGKEHPPPSALRHQIDVRWRCEWIPTVAQPPTSHTKIMTARSMLHDIRPSGVATATDAVSQSTPRLRLPSTTKFTESSRLPILSNMSGSGTVPFGRRHADRISAWRMRTMSSNAKVWTLAWRWHKSGMEGTLMNSSQSALNVVFIPRIPSPKGRDHRDKAWFPLRAAPLENADDWYCSLKTG